MATRRSFLRAALLATALLPLLARGQVFTHTEARHTHSVALTPDGRRLLAVHTNGASLSIFDLEGATPARVLEIPVGLEPVAVRARTDDEAWVVSEAGDSVAIVSLSRGLTVATLRVPDEPADVIFAQGKAFVSCAGDRLVRVFNVETRAEIAAIPLAGMSPRALAVDAAGTKIYAAFLHSGNGTTILPPEQAPAQPAPTNSALQPPPKTGLIVPVSDSRIPYTVLDHDVAEIDVATLTVSRYFGGTGTSLLDLALQPGTSELWVANTEALNLVRFEPNLRGHFVDNRISRVSLASGAVVASDLNPGLDYALLPNAAARSTALAQPSALAFTSTGAEVWVAAFGSDRVALVSSADGQVIRRVDLRTEGDTSRQMRGPRALALDEARQRLYVLNKLSSTISVLNTASGAKVAELPIGTRDPMPAPIREGRGFLFDARLSGNGTASCASCHLDADRDGLAWDLGDPSGAMAYVTGANLSAHDTRPQQRAMHPMKGPMTTQTLRGLTGGAPFHWRGDKPTLQSFNSTFSALMGGAELAPAEIDTLTAYLFSLRHHPNPNRTPDNQLPDEFLGGYPARGKTLFNQHTNHCAVCHKGPRGTDNNIDLRQEVGASQPLKNPPLATTYQRFGFNPAPGQATLTGFGLGHDGSGSVLPTVHPYVLDQLKGGDFADVAAYVLCFETGTAPAVGESVTITSSTAFGAAEALARLEAQHQASALDLIVRGTIGGEPREFIYSRALQLYVSDRFGDQPLSRSALLATLGPDDALTFLGAPPGEGARFGGDVDRNATLGADSFFTKSKTKRLSIAAGLGVLANDLRVAAPVDEASLSLPPALGTAVLQPDGSFTFLPTAGFGSAGLDSFAYRVRIAGSSDNTTAETTVTVSTMATAAGKYFGVLYQDGGNDAIKGHVVATVTATGSWSGQARLGAKVQALRGQVLADGTLRISGVPKLSVSLRLSAGVDGRRRVGAVVRSGTDLFSAQLQRAPFSKAAPAPFAGTRKLQLTVATATPGAPAAAGRATLIITKAGAATLTGKLGDGTSFSAAVPLGEASPAGWALRFYAPVFKYPQGSVTGAFSYDSAATPALAGTLVAERPAQIKPAQAPPPYTIEYAVSAQP